MKITIELCLKSILIVSLSVLNFHSALAETFDCAGYKGVCNIPAGATRPKVSPVCYSKAGGKELQCIPLDKTSCWEKTDPNTGKKIVSCPFFQCNSKGEVKLSDLKHNPRPALMEHNKRDLVIGFFTSSQFFCIYNCCYNTRGNQEFAGEANVTNSCRNYCCPTFAGYLAGNCSVSKLPGDIKSPPGSGSNPGEIFPGEIIGNKKGTAQIPVSPFDFASEDF